MSTKLNSRRFSAVAVRANILSQKTLRKITMALALCAPLLGANQAEAQVTLYKIPVAIQAEDFSAASGVKNEASATSGGGFYTGYINTGDWIDYKNHKVVIPVTGQYVVTYRVSSPYQGSSFSFNNINPSGSLSRINKIVVPKTGGLEEWVYIQKTVPLKAGPHYFGIRALSGGFTIDWIRIVAVSETNTSSSSSKSSVASSSTVSSIAKSSSSIAKSSVVSSSKASSSAQAVVSSRAVSSLAISSVKAISSLASSSKLSSSLASSSKVSSSAISSLASSSKVSSSAVSSLASSSKVSSSAISSLASSSKVSSSAVSSSIASSSSVSKSSVSSSSAPANGYTAVAGPVGLTWIAPKLREDKSALDITELGGYRLRYKSVEDSKYTYITINDPWATTYNFSWLEGAYIFEIAAFDDAGLLSDFSSFTE